MSQRLPSRCVLGLAKQRHEDSDQTLGYPGGKYLETSKVGEMSQTDEGTFSHAYEPIVPRIAQNETSVNTQNNLSTYPPP